MAEIQVSAYLSLGSNMGDRLENIRQACRLLEGNGTHVREVSSIYETEPVDFVDQPWFLNCVARIETILSPVNLLDHVHRIEDELDRRRERPKGPRTIDIDILLYADFTLESERLLLPHPEMLHRRFVLEPLREIAPTLCFPGSGKTVDQLFQELNDSSQVRRFASLEPTTS